MTEVLILNTAVVDFRGQEFAFADSLAGPGGLAKCKTQDMPPFAQGEYGDWIGQGRATAGGPGNCAPLMARAGIKVALGANLGKGGFGGLDAQGRFFHDVMQENGVDVSETHIHPTLPTGTTFLYEKDRSERGGIVYFPNANDDFDFTRFQDSVRRLRPKIVYYMYSGLSERGDANQGRDLAQFMRWCRGQGAVTIADSHTLTGNPGELIDGGATVQEYRLLVPLLRELDLFLTSSDEAQLIENTLRAPRSWHRSSDEKNIEHFLSFLAQDFWEDDQRTKMFGVTVRDGAFHTHMTPEGEIVPCRKTRSRFLYEGVIDLAGAGDSFRAGLISYVVRHLDAFRTGKLRFDEAIQMGNLFAALYIRAPLRDRYGNIVSFDKMLQLVCEGEHFDNFDELLNRLS
jgi:sugar/nucleoside kinase (ribokinase family)